MKKILSLLLCIPMFLFSLFLIHAEESETQETNENYELMIQDESGETKSVSTLHYDESQEELYRNTIGVILNEREHLGEIYAGYSINEEGLDSETEYTFILSGLMDDEQIMLFHILDVDNMMTEEILYEKVEGGIKFKSKPNSLFFAVHMDEIEINEEDMMLLSDNASNQVSQDFYYTGNVQEFTAPCSTTYKLEVWGASGGKDKQHEAAGGRIMEGGKGGYSSGEVTLQKGQKLYIAVGGEGESYAFNNSGGGWNGGGDAGGDLSSGGGGGATHIATTNLGELSRYSNNRGDVLIVAGGGGGGGYFSTGGHGGGLTANADSSGRSKGGAYGFGSGESRKSTDDGAGAGGGWAGGKVYVDANDYGAGGGTGYLGNVQNGISEIGKNSGNGKARITWTNEVTLTIQYLDYDTKENVYEPHSELLASGSSYSVKSPTINNYLLYDENQDTISGTLSSDTTVQVYYKKLPDFKKTVTSKNQDINGKYIQKGQELTYTLDIENPYNRAMQFTIEDEVPNGIDIVNINQNGEKNGNKITWNLTLPANSKGSVSFVAKANIDGASITNTAKAKISNREITSNIVKVYTPVLPIKAVKNQNGEDIHEELVKKTDTLTYEIKVKNIASEPKEFKVTDSLQDGLEYIDISDYGEIKDKKIVWNLTLQAGEEKTVTFKAKVKDGTVKITNKANQKVDNSDNDSNIVINYAMNYPIKKVLNKDNEDIHQEIIKKDEEVQYVISLENPSDKTKTFTFEDQMPNDFEIISMNIDANIQDGRVTFTKELPANSTFDVIIKGKPLKNSTSFANTAKVSVDRLNFETNQVVFFTSTPPVKSVYDEQGNAIPNTLIYAGENRKLTYTIEIHNPTTLEKEFIVQDKLNQTLIFDSASDEGKCENNIVTWTIKLAANEKKVLKLIVKPNDEYAGEKLVNQATNSSGKYIEATNIVVNYFDDKPEKIQIKGNIEWDDQNNKDKIRPGAVTIRLYANGIEIRNQKVITSKSTSFLFNQVQKYEKGKEIKYTIEEDEITDYTTTITNIKTNEFKVKNKHVPSEKENEETPKPTPSATPTATPTPSATPTAVPTLAPSASPTVKPITTPSTTPTVKSTPAATPTPKTLFTSYELTKVAPNTGDDYSVALPASLAVFALMLGAMVFMSLRRWK